MDDGGSVSRMEVGLSPSIGATELSFRRHDERLRRFENSKNDYPSLQPHQGQPVRRVATW